MTAGLTDDFRIPEARVTMRLSKIKVSLNIILFIVKKEKKVRTKQAQISPNEALSISLRVGFVSITEQD